MAKKKKRAAGGRSKKARESPQSAESERWAMLATALVVLLTFARGLSFGLVRSWDDGRFLIDFEPIQRISWAGLVRIWGEVHFQAWHPLHLLAYWLDVPLFGPSGPALHATNLLLWALALWALFRLMRKLGLSPWAAAFATLLVGVHPVQVEAVTWATGRKEILALLFSALAVGAHLDPDRYFDRVTFAEASGARRLRLLLRASLPGAFYILAALSKTSVLPLPGLMFSIDLFLRRERFGVALIRQLPSLLLGLGLSALVISIWSEHEMLRLDAAGGSSAGRVQLMAATYSHHLRTLLWPAETSPLYPIDRSDSFSSWIWLAPAVTVGAIGLAIWRRAWRALFLLLGFLLLLLPVLNLVPVYFQYQDRYLSLPLLVPAFGLGLLMTEAHKRLKSASARRALAAFGLLLVGALSARTLVYQGAWADDLSLWQHATRTHPSAFYAWMKLGELRRDRGELEQAVAAYQRGVEEAPTLRVSHAGYFQAVALLDEERLHLRPSRAMSHLASYLRAMSQPAALRRLAGTMAEEGYRDAALVPLGRSFDLRPPSDITLEQAALHYLERDEQWLARFHLRRMTGRPDHPRLQALLDGEGEPASDPYAQERDLSGPR